jgi:hypothetical protein
MEANADEDTRFDVIVRDHEKNVKALAQSSGIQPNITVIDPQLADFNSDWEPTALMSLYKSLASQMELQLKTNNFEILKYFTSDTAADNTKTPDTIIRELLPTWKGEEWYTEYWNKHVKKKNIKRCKLKLLPRSINNANRKKIPKQYNSAGEFVQEIKTYTKDETYLKRFAPWYSLTWEHYFMYTLKSSKLYSHASLQKYENIMSILWGTSIGFNLQTGKILCLSALNPSRTWFASITSNSTTKVMKHLRLPNEVVDVVTKIMKCAEAMLAVKSIETSYEKNGKISCHDLAAKQTNKIMDQIYDLGAFAATPDDWKKYATNHPAGPLYELVSIENQKSLKKIIDMKRSMDKFYDDVKTGLISALVEAKTVINVQLAGRTDAEKKRLLPKTFGAKFAAQLALMSRTYNHDFTASSIQNAHKALLSEQEQNDYWTLGKLLSANFCSFTILFPSFSIRYPAQKNWNSRWAQ